MSVKNRVRQAEAKAKRRVDQQRRRAESRRKRDARPIPAVPGDASVFRLALAACGGILETQGRAALASQLDAASTSDADIAAAFAEGHPPIFQPEATAGALAALRGETPGPAEDETG